MSTAGTMNTIAPSLRRGAVEIAGGNQMTIHRVGGETEVYEAPGIPYQAHQHLFDEFLNWP